MISQEKERGGECAVSAQIIIDYIFEMEFSHLRHQFQVSVILFS